MDQDQYIKRRPCQTPAPLAWMKDEQKKIETEADDQEYCPKHTTHKQSCSFSLQMTGNPNRIKLHRLSQDKAFCGHFLPILETKCNDGPVSKVCFPWCLRPFCRFEDNNQLEDDCNSNPLWNKLKLPSNPQLISTEKSFLDSSTCLFLLIHLSKQPRRLLVQFDYNTLSTIWAKLGSRHPAMKQLYLGVPDRCYTKVMESQKIELKLSSAWTSFSPATSTQPGHVVFHLISISLDSTPIWRAGNRRSKYEELATEDHNNSSLDRHL